MRAELPGLKSIRVERDGAVDWLMLNRPERLNTLTGTMVGELCTYFDGLRSNFDTRIVVMRGAGRAFCAGLDIKEHQGGDRVPEGAGRAKPGYHLFDIVRLMRGCPQPIIALVHGPACGGGFAMALNSRRSFCCPGESGGLSYGWNVSIGCAASRLHVEPDALANALFLLQRIHRVVQQRGHSARSQPRRRRICAAGQDHRHFRSQHDSG